MKKIAALLTILLSFAHSSFAQSEQNIMMYIVDSIPVINDPEQGNQIDESEIADVTVIKSKDSLKSLGYDKFDAAIYIFTKEYRNRPESVKQIPSTRQMERKSGLWYFRGSPYNGQFIDYYYSGRKQGEGTFKDGRAEGLRKTYFQNGKISTETYYSNGIENGLEKEYYEDGSLKQKGEFVNGKEEGLWQMYFPNGQVKQKSNFKNGNIEGETIVYYSTGKILAVEISKNGKTNADKRLEKVNQQMSKGHASSTQADYKSALKHYSKAIELDTTFAQAYFARGTIKLNDSRFDEAIHDFDKALAYEPYYDKALSSRALARIRKHQFAGSRQLSGSSGATILASKSNPAIPATDLSLICADLKKAMFLGDRGKIIMEAMSQFCEAKSSR